MQDKKKPGKINVRRENIKALVLSILVILAVNMLGSRFFFRLDLTAEKRFTLTPATRQLLRELDDFVFFQVYLEGEFPAGFKRLRNQTREMLDEFRAFSPFIQYEFINPTVKGDWDRTEENYSMLVRKGLQPTQLQVTAEDASSQQIIFPGAVAGFRGREAAISLLHDQMGMASENVINNSIQALEYNLASAIHKLISDRKPRIAFLEGNGELDFRYVADITFSLEDYYEVERLAIESNPEALTDINTLIVAQPLEEFTEPDKFIIDQFIMSGGSVLWLIDPVFASMDSLQIAPETLGMLWPLNLDDMLFRYGARLNADLVMDLQSVPIPITTGFMGDRPQISLIPWHYFPLVSAASGHPVVRNLNSVRTEFVSTIDTIAVEGIQKTFLLQSSPYSRVLQTPVRISFDIMQSRVNEELYRAGPQKVAVLLEGEFPSLFANRRSPVENLPANFQRRDRGEASAMIIVADGDIIRNQFDNRNQPLPLGYDRFLDQTFGNADFILNAVNYLNDDRGLMEARTREVRLRLLDRSRISQSRFAIQTINIVVPLLVVLLFGMGRFYWRKRKYGKAG